MRFTRTAIAVAAMTISCNATAQTYPTKPVRIVVVSSAGGSVDTMARTVGAELTERWGQQVVIDNRGGAGGAIAAEIVAKAPPDGYTLIMGTVASFAINVSLRKKLPYDPVKDFEPISLVATQSLILLVNKTIPAKSVKELIALAKKQPGKLSFASAGNGTGGHLSGELFKDLADIDMLHVPYKGVAAALLDVVSGQVSMSFASVLSSLPQIKADRVVPLAITSTRRSPVVPHLPTMIEAGVKGYESGTWYGLLAPAGTPRAIMTKLNSEVVTVMKGPAMIDRLSKEGANPVGSSSAEFARHIQSEIAKWRKVVKAAGIEPR
jgi:tripartite-type tricarboxylate transporter receptor subunit TctC